MSSKIVKLHEVGRGSVAVTFTPDEAERAQIAKDLSVVAAPALTARVTVKPWLEGAEIFGRIDAVVTETCSISLEDFDTTISSDFSLRVVPAGSALAPLPDTGEIELDVEADDPPDVLESDVIDVGAYVVEHLALELDPYPRKPGVSFDYASGTEETSPFAALKALKDKP
jgi:uncharacterized metal-binding protein YceD (DUF177 family)